MKPSRSWIVRQVNPWPNEGLLPSHSKYFTNASRSFACSAAIEVLSWLTYDSPNHHDHLKNCGVSHVCGFSTNFLQWNWTSIVPPDNHWMGSINHWYASRPELRVYHSWRMWPGQAPHVLRKPIPPSPMLSLWPTNLRFRGKLATLLQEYLTRKTRNLNLCRLAYLQSAMESTVDHTS